MIVSLLLWGSMAHAADAQVQVDPSTLAEGRLPVSAGTLPAAGEVTAVDVLYDGVVQVGADCRLKITADAILRVGSPDSCPWLWTLEPDGTGGGVVGLRFRHAGRVVQVEGVVGEPAAPKPPEAVVVDVPFERPLEPVAAELQPRSSRGAASDGVEDWCPESDSQELVLCWDTVPTRPVIRPSTPSQVVDAGTEVTVYVRHLEDAVFRVSQTGQMGLDEPGVREEPGVRNTEKRVFVTPVPFAPRKAGPATVELELDGTTYRYELLVQKTYAGALRTGIGFAFGGALDASYGSATAAGSDQAEVVATSRGGVDVELVVGFAPFLRPGGRPATGCVRIERCFAPYVGVGIIAPRASGVDVLTSVHAGLEWEPVKTFSIAGTAAVRRVTRLADGVAVGSPTVGAPPTTEGWGVGVGVVLNVSPEFFKVASKGVL